MGCLQSRDEDIRRDRERVKRRQPTGAANDRQEPLLRDGGGLDERRATRPLGIAGGAGDNDATGGGGGGNGDVDIYGSSYTDRKTKEFDFMHNLVEKTQHNFIDVSQRPLVLDDIDVEEKSHEYEQRLREQASTYAGEGEQALTAAMRLPAPVAGGDSVSGVVAQLQRRGLSSASRLLVQDCACTVTEALDTMSVDGSKVPGRLVISFAQFCADTPVVRQPLA
jgi:hypothetical protein